MISEANIFKQIFVDKSSKRRPVLLAFFCLVSLIITPVLSGCGEQKPKVNVLQIEGETMGTTYHIKSVAAPGVSLTSKELKQMVDEELVAFNQIVSTYIPDSELSLLNKAPVDTWIEVSDTLYAVMSDGQTISKMSEGAYDPTVGPIVNLYGFGPEKKTQTLPTDDVIAETLKRVGYHKIKMDAEKLRVKKQAKLYIDYSGLAKGYGVDVIAQLLEDEGFDRYMVEIGGELRVKGQNGENAPWVIGVEKPSLGHAGALQKIAIKGGGAIATSGEYRNYREVEGKRVSHTIDPATGFPIEHALASVTVIASNCAEADAFATALNVMGDEKGIEWAEKMHLAVYFIVKHDDGFIEKHTSQFSQFMVQ